MSLPEQYLVTAKNLEAFFNSIINAQPPKKFTLKFLEQLEFKSTNDRLLIGILKALDFVDSDGVPQEKYFQFIDQTQSKKVLADAIKEAYSDLFAINLKAYELSESEIKNKLKTIFAGSKSDNILTWMAKTFRGLCDYADFSATKVGNKSLTVKQQSKGEDEYSEYKQPENQAGKQPNNDNKQNTFELINKEITTEMHYNIQIHLPETRDMAVYDAIFRSLKEHLL